MRSKGNAPSAEQKRWMESIADFYKNHGDLIWGDLDYSNQFQLHHMFGVTAKHNKIAIGHWAVLAMPAHMHDPGSSHPIHIHKAKSQFNAVYGDQKEMFSLMLCVMDECGYTIPFDEMTRQAIEEYHK